MKKPQEKKIRLAAVILCEIFTLITVVKMLIAPTGSRVLMAFATLLLVLLPELMERILRCHFSLPVYLFSVFYAMGPMLGHCWDLYYVGIGWDKLLHIAGGVMFALVGAFVYDLLNKGEPSNLMRALFALCFSVAISVLWEFVEYSSDLFLHTDMQNDTLVSAIHSYLLTDLPGVAGSLENIQTVTVNSVTIPGGYIDIGLHDTMQDMLVETVGAIITFAALLLGKGKLPITPVKKEEKTNE